MLPAHQSLETRGLKHNLTGRKFGRFFVVSLSHKTRINVHWVAACACGQLCSPTTSNLIAGLSASCGCMTRERGRIARVTHGGTVGGHSPLYRIWHAMQRRCYDDSNERYVKYYQSRGITVCREWRKSFVAFREWALKNGYKDNLTIDREDNDGNYTPSNCRWATHSQQVSNRRFLGRKKRAV